ncbi:DUF4396 domain-containing protein [Kineococcus sp. NUM-3379]
MPEQHRLPVRPVAHDHHGTGGTHHGNPDHLRHGSHGGAGEHRRPGNHEHHEHHGGRVSWRTAAQATLHCLTGCAVGEVLGMVIGTALGWGTLATVALAVGLAFVFGYALTVRPLLRAGLGLRAALKVALAADTVSIAVMEIVDNAAMVAIPGAMHSGLGSWVFWASLAGALALAFVVTTPVNRWLIGRGRGHALVHAHHR